MWTKDDYQEHMSGYLEGVRIEIDRLARLRVQSHSVNEFYTRLDIALDCLRQLILASDVEWEGYRYTLEASCDSLLRTFYRVPPAGTLILSVSFMMIENDEATAQAWQPAPATSIAIP
jgi:hypothetical protein